MTLKGRGKLRYKCDEPYLMKSNNETTSTMGTLSSSSSRNMRTPKEISQFNKEFDGKEEKKVKQNSSQENLSKTYACIIKNIITPQENGKRNERILEKKKYSEDKGKSQEVEETKEFSETSSSQRNFGYFFFHFPYKIFI